MTSIDPFGVTYKPGKLFIIRKVTTKADGTPRKRPVYERDGVIYTTLKAARKGNTAIKYYIVSWTELLPCEEERHRKCLISAPAHLNDDQVAEITLLHFNTDNGSPSKEWAYRKSWGWWMMFHQYFRDWCATEVPKTEWDVLCKHLNTWALPDHTDINWSFDVDAFKKEATI